MSMVRMFHIACDNPGHSGWDLGDDWYSDVAYLTAKRAGYHISGKLAICPECWDTGIRYSDCA